MLILIHQVDVTITISPFEEQPKNKFATIECEEAAVLKEIQF
jgi:hypothetical protein